jgi:hypothetical protein
MSVAATGDEGVTRTVMEKVKASVDPEPALEKFGCGVSRRENIFR